jgi:uncharacterized protein YuzE
MKVIYDPETDTLSLILWEEAVVESDAIREGVIIDYGRDGRIVSLEVLDASEHVTDPRGIAYELKGRQRIP